MKKIITHLYYALRKYIAIAKVNCATKMAYPIDQLSGCFFLLFIFSILFFLHRTTLTSASASQTEGLTLAQIMWIIFVANIFGAERGRGVSQALNDDILSGQIAYQLNRPYSYILFHLAQNIGMRLPTFLLSGGASALFLYTLVGLPPLSMPSLMIGASMITIGIVIHFLINFCIGLCAFWIGNVDPLRWIYRQANFIAGGAAVPLALFPATLKKILILLPFSNIVYGGARLLVDFNHSNLLLYVGLQLFWLCAMIVITRYLLSIGVKNVVIGGG